MSAKHWCFTINNYTEDEFTQLVTLGESIPSPQIKYLIIGKEQGEQGTPHLQGYIALVKKKRLNPVKALVGQRAHLEVARGSPSQNIEYCSKEGQHVSWGEVPHGQGSGDVMASIKELAETGNLDAIREQHYGHYLRYQNSILRDITRYGRSNRDAAPIVEIYWGPTGTGKSRKAFEENPGAYWKPYGNKWFDNYDGQPWVVIDEFVGWLPITMCLRLCDRYPVNVETKGGSVNFVATKIIFTSNLPMEEWWPNARQEHIDAFRRRVTTIVHMDTPFQVAMENVRSRIQGENSST